ncbi:hypothetical protein, partial [Clostridium perfringens]
MPAARRSHRPGWRNRTIGASIRIEDESGERMRVMMAASLAVIAMATAGCQVKVSDAANNTAAATPAAAAPASKGDWAKFRDGFIEGWFRLD